MVDKEKLAKEAEDRAWDLIDDEMRLPSIAMEEYRGPSEAITAMVRGALLGAVGYFAGKRIGRAADPKVVPGGHREASHSWSTGFKWVMGGMGTLLGLQSGSRQVRESRSQTRQLQQTIERIHEQNMALKKELKAQLRGKGGLLIPEVESKISNDASSASYDKPEVDIELSGATHETLELPLDERQL